MNLYFVHNVTSTNNQILNKYNKITNTSKFIGFSKLKSFIPIIKFKNK